MSVQTTQNCPSCGAPTRSGARFCESCGESITADAPAADAPVPATGPVHRSRSGKATASLIFGIIGIVILPMVFSLLAFVLGIAAKREIGRNPGLQGNGHATAGLVLGAVGLALIPIWAILVLGG